MAMKDDQINKKLKQNHKKRGICINKKVNKKFKGEKIRVEWNNKGQSIGTPGTNLNTTVGCLARSLLLIGFTDWRLVGEKLKDDIWASILDELKSKSQSGVSDSLVLGTDEHGGRVRGIGKGVILTTYFSHIQRESDDKDKLLKELMRQLVESKAEIARLKGQESYVKSEGSTNKVELKENDDKSRKKEDVTEDACQQTPKEPSNKPSFSSPKRKLSRELKELQMEDIQKKKNKQPKTVLFFERMVKLLVDKKTDLCVKFKNGVFGYPVITHLSFGDMSCMIQY